VIEEQKQNSFPLYGGRLGWGYEFIDITPPHLNPPPSATKRGEIRPQSVFGRIAPTLSGEQGGRKIFFYATVSY